MKTVLLGLDGATYTVLDHLVAQGVMPRLGEVYARGARAILESTPTPLTPQAWTSLATGRGAGAHGIGDFIRCDRQDRGTYLHINNARDIRVETIWQYVSRQRQRVTVLNYFGLAPPQPLNGHSMPGFTTGRHLRRSSYPPDLFDRLRQAPNLDVALLGMDLDIERQGLQELEPDQWIEWIGHHIERERVWLGVLEHLMRTEPSDLTAIVLDGVDKIQHLAYRYLDPSLAPANPTSWEREVLSLCHAYFRQVDEAIGRIGADVNLFIASDHGFAGSYEIVYINKFLEDQGWLAWQSDARDDQRQAFHTDRPADDANAIDIAGSRAYALSPSGNGVFLGGPPEERAALREEVVRRLLSLRGPDGGQIVTDVKRREEYFPGPCMELLPDLTLSLRDFGFISVLKSPQVVVPRARPLGTHHPDGVLLAQGAGIRAGATCSRLSILDVAPTLLYSLGLPIPDDYEGRLANELFERDWLGAHAPQAGGCSDVQAASSEGDEALDEEEEAILMDRLRSLGYIE